MFFDLIRNRRTVRIYYGREEGFILTTIKRYYPKTDMIRIADGDALIPLRAVAKIEIVDEPAGETHAFSSSGQARK